MSLKVYKRILFCLLSWLLGIVISFSQTAGFRVNGNLISRNDTVRVCKGNSLIYSNTATGFSGISWIFKKGTPSTFSGSNPPAITYSSVGVDSTLQIVSFGANKDTFLIYVQVSDIVPTIPLFSFSPISNECSSVERTFTVSNPQPGTNYTWNFGDGSAPVVGATAKHTYNTIGNGTSSFSISVTATNAGRCSAISVNQTLTVRQRPNAVLSEISDFRYCGSTGNTTLNVFDGSSPATNANYQIDWGDNNLPNYNSPSKPSGLAHTYLNGIFTLSYYVTGSNGCSDSIKYTILNISNPQIGATIPANSSGCAPLRLGFPINSFAPNHSSTVYEADYGDGKIDTFSHPPPDTIWHIYNKSSCLTSNKQFSFTIRAINGCTPGKSEVSPITIYIKPTAKFKAIPDQACVNSTITFTNTTTTGFNSSCNSTAIYKWDFGDNTSVNVLTNVPQTHSYSLPGTYNVILTATNSCDSTKDTIPVCITLPPVPRFTLPDTASCAPFSVKATNTSDTGSCSPVKYKWSVSYAAAFCGTSASWAFAPGFSDTSTSPSFSFTGPGRYTLTLAIVSPSCGNLTFSKIINVKAPPKITNWPKIPAYCDSVTLCPKPTVTNCGSDPLDYLWKFEGGTPASSILLNPCYFISGAGTYKISLNLSNECGVTIDSQVLKIDSIIISNAGPNQNLCGATSVTMAANPATPGTGRWTKVSGPTATIPSLPHSPTLTIGLSTSGTYVFRWTITNGSCTSFSDVTIVNHPKPPKPTVITPIQYCLDGTASPLSVPPLPGHSLTWFPPVAGSTVAPTPATDKVGCTDYQVLQTDDATTCQSDRATIRVCVNAKITGNIIGNNQTLSCTKPLPIGQASGSTLSGGNGTYIYEWYDANNILLGAGSTLTPTVAGTYRRVIKSGGCIDTSNKVSIIIESSFSPIDICCSQSICEGTLPALLTGATPTGGSGAFIYQWESSLNNINFLPVPGAAGLNYQPPALFVTTYYKRKTTSGGCTGYSNTDTITVYKKPNAGAIIPGNSNLCEGSNITFTNATVTGNIFKWDTTGLPVTTGSIWNSAGSASSVTFSSISKSFAIRLIAVSEGFGKGCNAMDTSNMVQVTVNNKPIGGITGNDATICTGANSGSITLTGYSGEIDRWESSTDNFVTDINPISNTNPVLPYTGLSITTWFRAVLKSGVCPEVNSGTTKITVVNSVSDANAGPDQFWCNQTSVTLAGSSPSVGMGTWTQTCNPPGNPANITDPGLNNTRITGMVPGLYCFTWTIAGSPQCKTSVDEVQIRIWPPTTKANAGNDITICDFSEIESVMLSANAPQSFETGRWTIVNQPPLGNGIFGDKNSPSSSFTFYKPGAYTLEWKIINQNLNSCGPDSAQVKILVFEKPQAGPVMASSSHVCAGSNVTFTTTPVIGTIKKWQYNPAPISDGIWRDTTLTGSPVIFRNVLNTFQVRVIIQSNGFDSGCSDTAISDPITVNVSPRTIGGESLRNDTVCSGNNYGIITLSAHVGDITNWQYSVGCTGLWRDTAISTNPFIYGGLTKTACFRAIVKSGVCLPQFSTITKITVLDSVTISNVGPDQFLCNKTSTNLSANNPTVGVGKWRQVCGPPVTIDNPLFYNTSVSGLSPGLYCFRWTISISPLCDSSFDEVEIRIWPPTTKSNAGNDITICDFFRTRTIALAANQPQTFEKGSWKVVTQPDGSTYGFGLVNSNTSTFTFDKPGLYTLRWTISNDNTNGCAAENDLLNINVFETPVAGAITASSTNVCEGTVVTFNTTPVTGTFRGWQYKFLSGNTWTDFSGSITALQSLKVRAIIQSEGFANGCPDTAITDSIIVHVSSKSIGGLTQPDIIVCSGSNQGLIGLSGQSGDVLFWQASTNASTWLNLVNTNARHQFNNLVKTTWYRAVVKNGACDTAFSSVTKITVTDAVTQANAGEDQLLCDVSETTLKGNNPLVGNGVWKQLDANPAVNFANSRLYNTRVSGLVSGNVYRFQWMITSPLSAGDCDTSADTVEIKIGKGVTNANAGPNQSVCDFASPRTITLAANTPIGVSETGRWRLLSEPLPGSGTFIVPSSPSSLFTITQPGVYQLEWRISSDIIFSCNLKTDTMLVYAYAALNVPYIKISPLLFSTCNHDTTITFTATPSYTGTDTLNYKWFVNGEIADSLKTFTRRFVTPLMANAFTYNITALAQNVGGCGDTSAKAKGEIFPLPVAAISVNPLFKYQPDYEFAFNDTGTINPNYSYMWHLGERNLQTRSGKSIKYEFGDTGIYQVKLYVTDVLNGCYASDSVKVRIIPVPGYLQVPTVFCPGCSKNELKKFLPLGKGLRDYRLRIFTTWGQLVFETALLNADGSPQQAWDGRFKGQVLDQDVYSWIIDAHYVNGTEWKGMKYPGTQARKFGTVTILK